MTFNAANYLYLYCTPVVLWTTDLSEERGWDTRSSFCQPHLQRNAVQVNFTLQLCTLFQIVWRTWKLKLTLPDTPLRDSGELCQENRKLNKNFCYKRDVFSHILHFSSTKCKFALIAIMARWAVWCMKNSSHTESSTYNEQAVCLH